MRVNLMIVIMLIINRFAQSAWPEVKKNVLENMENKQRGNKQLNEQKTLTIDETTTKTSRITKKYSKNENADDQNVGKSTKTRTKRS